MRFMLIEVVRTQIHDALGQFVDCSIGCWGGERAEGKRGPGGRKSTAAHIPTLDTDSKTGAIIYRVAQTYWPLCQRIASGRFPSLSITLLRRIVGIICCDLCSFFPAGPEPTRYGSHSTTSLHLHARNISTRPLWLGKWEQKMVV